MVWTFDTALPRKRWDGAFACSGWRRRDQLAVSMAPASTRAHSTSYRAIAWSAVRGRWTCSVSREYRVDLLPFPNSIHSGDALVECGFAPNHADAATTERQR